MLHQNVDILEIDKGIRNKKIDFDSVKKRVHEIDSVLSASETIGVKLKKMLESERRKLIQLLDYPLTVSYYTLEVQPVLNKYKELMDKPIKIKFGKGKSIDYSEKETIIRDFLAIAKKYTSLDIGYCWEKKESSEKCEECSIEYEDEPEESVKRCYGCGKEYSLPVQSSSYKDGERVNMAPKFSYKRRVHFKDCMKELQGTQNTVIEKEVFEDLERNFKENGLLNTKAKTEKQRFSKVTIEIILRFLKITGHTKHYKDAGLIYKMLTGKKLHEIAHLEDQLMQDFDELTELYDKIYIRTKAIDRKSFIPSHYLLYQLLRKHKYKCKSSDFNMLKTDSLTRFHDKICKHLFELKGWNFKSIF